MAAAKWAIVIAMFLLLTRSELAYGQNTSCGTSVENVTVNDDSTVHIYNNACNTKNGRLNVRYVWLNINAASMVLSGFLPEELSPILGKSTLTVETPVKKHIDYILQNFGALIGDSPPGIGAQVISPRGEQLNLHFSDETNLNLKNRSKAIKHLRYLPLEPFPWPKAEIIHSFTNGPNWPKGDYTYTRNSNPISYLRSDLLNPETAISTVFSCIIHYDFIDRNEFRRYWDMAQNAADLVIEGKIGTSNFEYQYGDLKRESVAKSIIAGHPSYDTLEYFGRKNWPADFLVRIGHYNDMDGCAPSAGGFSIAAVPRTPFILFAIVSSTDGHLPINRLSFLLDEEDSIRNEAKHTEPYAINLSSSTVISADHTIAIPLQMELRYDLQSDPIIQLTAEYMEQSKSTFQLIKKLAPPEIGFASTIDGDDWIFSKQTSLLPAPTSKDITRKYIYGEALQLKEIQSTNDLIEISKAPAQAVMANQFWEEGSCPFLTFLDKSGTRISRNRILIGASQKSLSKTETISVPEGATHFRIEEVEPEISYVEDLFAISENGIRKSLGPSFMLTPQEGLEFAIPKSVHEIEIRGYYDLL